MSTPTTRSRTLLFFSYRDSTARVPRSLNIDDDDDEHALLIHPPIRDHLALTIHDHQRPSWADISDNVHALLDTTRVKITALDKLHAKHVLPGFADRSAEEREIEDLSSDITRDFRRCKQLIQSIPDSAKRDRDLLFNNNNNNNTKSQHVFPPQKPNNNDNEARKRKREREDAEDARAAMNVQRALAAKVQETSALFRKKQKVYLETLQGHAIKNQDLLIASGAVQLKGQEGMSDLDEDLRAASSNQTLLLSSQTTQTTQTSDDETLLTARTHELTQIARSIATLAELFRDLGHMVIDQGSLLDSVEYNLQAVAHDAEEAGRELGKAEGYQRRTGRRKCVALLVLVIVGLALVLAFKPRRGAGAGGEVGGEVGGEGGEGGGQMGEQVGRGEESERKGTVEVNVAGNFYPLPVDDVGAGASHVYDERLSRSRSSRLRMTMTKKRRAKPR